MGKRGSSSALADPVRMRIRAAEQLLGAAYDLIPRYGRIAVYLSGLSAECSLKAHILCQVKNSQRRKVDASAEFRGREGHSYDDLRRLLRRLTGGRDVPVEWARDLRYIGGVWSVDMRYEPKLLPEKEATAVWEAASRLLVAIRRTV
jgi:hypothetical protein